MVGRYHGHGRQGSKVRVALEDVSLFVPVTPHAKIIENCVSLCVSPAERAYLCLGKVQVPHFEVFVRLFQRMCQLVACRDCQQLTYAPLSLGPSCHMCSSYSAIRTSTPLMTVLFQIMQARKSITGPVCSSANRSRTGPAFSAGQPWACRRLGHVHIPSRIARR